MKTNTCQLLYCFKAWNHNTIQRILHFNLETEEIRKIWRMYFLLSQMRQTESLICQREMFVVVFSSSYFFQRRCDAVRYIEIAYIFYNYTLEMISLQNGSNHATRKTNELVFFFRHSQQARRWILNIGIVEDCAFERRIKKWRTI